MSTLVETAEAKTLDPVQRNGDVNYVLDNTDADSVQDSTEAVLQQLDGFLAKAGLTRDILKDEYEVDLSKPLTLEAVRAVMDICDVASTKRLAVWSLFHGEANGLSTKELVTRWFQQSGSIASASRISRVDKTTLRKLQGPANESNSNGSHSSGLDVPRYVVWQQLAKSLGGVPSNEAFELWRTEQKRKLLAGGHPELAAEVRILAEQKGISFTRWSATKDRPAFLQEMSWQQIRDFGGALLKGEHQPWSLMRGMLIHCGADTIAQMRMADAWLKTVPANVAKKDDIVPIVGIATRYAKQKYPDLFAQDGRRFDAAIGRALTTQRQKGLITLIDEAALSFLNKEPAASSNGKVDSVAPEVGDLVEHVVMAVDVDGQTALPAHWATYKDVLAQQLERKLSTAKMHEPELIFFAKTLIKMEKFRMAKHPVKGAEGVLAS